MADRRSAITMAHYCPLPQWLILLTAARQPPAIILLNGWRVVTHRHRRRRRSPSGAAHDRRRRGQDLGPNSHPNVCLRASFASVHILGVDLLQIFEIAFDGAADVARLQHAQYV